MQNGSGPAIAGIVAAIAITTTMDATGYAAFSALPLFPLAGLFWLLQRFSRAEFGLAIGTLLDVRWALAYPLLVLGAMALIAWLAGAVDVAATDWGKTLANVGLIASSGVILVLITEEAFFRGWLWASLKRAGHSERSTLIWSTLAFTAWHLSAISLDTGFDVPAAEIPVYLVNASLLGAIWGVLRWVSGSVVVAAVSHAVWNGIDYPLFGFGEKAGALGIQQTHLFGPEVGLLGILLNGAFLLWIWRKYAVPAKK